MNNHELLRDVAELGQLLVDKGWTFACAESCTGGLLAAAMTTLPGSSAWFDRGLVTYSNAAKIQLLGVNGETLERFGAVSEETAMEMAAGVLDAAPDAFISISTTGIAGPDGATPGKPVGMVCFGFSQRAAQGVVTRALTKVFEGDRNQIRATSVAFALQTAVAQLR
ncbi:nicotinamide-nucleotide amidohydrolase family protein [Alcaligenaceae bacterium]|nr:nicotinamide-nucleotide amidohydrolase family protein [Alcaligenaceae bacterium]